MIIIKENVLATVSSVNSTTIAAYVTSVVENAEFREEMLLAHDEAVKSIDLSEGITFFYNFYESSKIFVTKVVRDAKKKHHLHRIMSVLKAEEALKAEALQLNQDALVVVAY